MPHLLISAAHKSSGKTTLCVGLGAEWSRLGLQIQSFKKGPDYIDPLWLTQATQRPCYNLDFYTQDQDEIRQLFASRMVSADLGLIEGNKGLYDGLDLHGHNSNAALAKLLGAPVVLVIDTEGMTRGIAPLLLGYQDFDPAIRIAGVILNKVNGSRHESKLRAVIEHYTDIPVVGSVQRCSELVIVERHLGLIPSNEAQEASAQIERIRRVVAEQVEFSALSAIADGASPLDCATAPVPVQISSDTPLRIGIAQDRAFGFYYPGDLEAMVAAGALLVPFSPMTDRQLPDVDGIFIGGGFPEMHLAALEANGVLRAQLRDYVESGRPLYAECGGLMYLSRSIQWRDETCSMVGIIPGDTRMYDRPQGRGYVRLRPTQWLPWPLSVTGDAIAAHEFHYSRLENLASGQIFGFEMLRGTGIDGSHDGLVYKNLLACYSHLRNVGGCRWTEHFLHQVQTYRRR